MRRLKVYIILLLAATLTANAQQTADKQKSVYLEVFGASNLAGLNYDSRFKAGSQWGYRVGLGYTYSKSYSMFSGSNSLNGANVPMEINYLLGKKRSRLELGFGLNLGYYTEKYDTWNTKLVGDYNGIPYYETEYAGEASHSTWGYYFFGNIGYRYQLSHGFQFRAGISPSFNLGGDHAVSKNLVPYISFGYVF